MKLIKPNLSKKYLNIVKGKGIYVYDDTGKEYIDAISGVGVTCLGYQQEELAQTLYKQAMEIPYVHAMRFDNEPLLKLTEKMGEIAPAGMGWCFFCSGGSEANEGAYKLARQYQLEIGKPNKYKIIGRTQSFHGNTLFNLSVGHHPLRRKRYQPMLVDFPHASCVNCYRCPYGKEYPECGLACADSLEELILREDPDTVAAFIMEPIVGAAMGCPVPPAGYAKRIREICEKYDILLIVDEVMTGFGRTGKWFGIEHEGITPDIITFAKGISSGYAPLGGMLFTDEIGNAFINGSKYFEHNFTYAGNPLCAAVGLKTIEIMQRDHYVEQADEKGEKLFKMMRERLNPIRVVGDIRGRGLFMGVELVKNKQTKEPFLASEQGNVILERISLEEGVVLYPCTGSAGGGFDGVHFILFVPFIITDEELEELVRRIERICLRFESEVSDLLC